MTSDPTERERLARLIYEAAKGRIAFVMAEYFADVILEDGFHREGAPRTPTPEPEKP